MATIARIIVTKVGLEQNRNLFEDFITESQKLLAKGEKKHQFVLLPGGFLTFPVNDLTHISISEPEEKAEKREWNTNIEILQNQALTAFRSSFDSKMLEGLKSVANYLVIGIDGKFARDKGAPVQFVLVYDLQSGKPLHWTGKTYPQKVEKKYLIQMPINTHFIKKKINGKKVAVFGCHDLSIFNQRHQHLFSPFDNERKNKKTGKIEKRKVNSEAGRIKCPFIDATLDFSPDIMLQLPHSEGPWAAKWTKLDKWLQRKNNGKGLQHFATGLKKNPPQKQSPTAESKKPPKQFSLSGTQSSDVVNFEKEK